MAATEQKQAQPGDEQAFLEYVQGGGQVETADWLPDDYRAKLVKFIEMHGNSELMGVLPEREWILRAPTLQRKLALTAKVQDEVGQEALDRWWGPLMQFHGNPIPKEDDPMYQWRIKSQGNEEARQQFLDGYVPQIWELGLTVPDPKLRKRDDGVWEYTEPDWDELKHVVTGHGPKTQERLDLRRTTREETAWVRRVALAAAA